MVRLVEPSGHLTCPLLQLAGSSLQQPGRVQGAGRWGQEPAQQPQHRSNQRRMTFSITLVRNLKNTQHTTRINNTQQQQEQQQQQQQKLKQQQC